LLQLAQNSTKGMLNKQGAGLVTYHHIHKSGSQKSQHKSKFYARGGERQSKSNTNKSRLQDAESRRFTPSKVDRPLLTFWAAHAGDNYCTRPFHCCCPVQSVCGWWIASSSEAAAGSCPPWRRPSRTRLVAQRSLTALALSTSNRETAATVPHATEPGKFGLWATEGRKYGDSYKTACKSGWALKKFHLSIF